MFKIELALAYTRVETCNTVSRKINYLIISKMDDAGETLGHIAGKIIQILMNKK